MADSRKKQLAFNIIDFLRTSAQDGTVKEDDKESLDVAVQVISEAFGVDPESPEDQAAYSMKPASLLALLDVFAKTKSKTSGAPATPAAAATASTSSGPSADDKAKADELKAKGNALMSKKQYDDAIEQYTEAIKLAPNPVYYSNRAAAHGALFNHDKAAEDAQRAIDLDPKFAKGFSRLGHALFSQGQFQEAIDAYEAGLKIDPGNANMSSSLATAKSRLAEQSPQSPSTRDAQPGVGGAGAGGAGGMPDLSALAGMMGGLGGGGGGGMPDLASLMQNPQMMAMAQQMMANGGLERLMANPSMRAMAENMQNGGGMPDLSALASDPNMRDIASQFMGGGGAGGAGRQ